MRVTIQNFENFKSEAMALALKYGIPSVEIKEPLEAYFNKAINRVCEELLSEPVCFDEFVSARYRDLMEMRQSLFYVLIKDYNIPCQDIAKYVGMHRTTVKHGMEKCETLLSINDQVITENVYNIRELLKQ